ncbi:uncharacterized protein BXZ73DRAFT_43776 [Epithele typhae]|uniref:uncharacterized protein n=1 Tax=Epithele typhae TaxID=378194 RepID=UPI002008173E|nr:uncharacterized protein BXZ73DRAFT_43776 [Epithele typhae]KAH9939312.1 hypothetical protein BXZ73DRAFT_43776 [Epithele typhae]
MAMFVYGLHDFSPENPDEVSFKVGDQIEVIERDDLYGDGWWKGRNPQGEEGLFPQSYTSLSPPVSSSVAFPDNGDDPSLADGASAGNLGMLKEVSETTSRQSPTPSERERKLSQGDVMMRATMTDVQKAIEQLGRNDRDGARSFSFRSSHGDYSERSETETEDEGDADEEDDVGWHKDARAKLAQRAQRENEQRQAREAKEAPHPMIPPIDVEVSDESDGDEDSPLNSHRQHRYSRIPEEDEESEASPTKNGHSHGYSRVPAEDEKSDVNPVKTVHPNSAPTPSSSDSIIPSAKYIVPDESDLPTATRLTFPDTPPSPADTSPAVEIPPVEITGPTPAEAPATSQAPAIQTISPAVAAISELESTREPPTAPPPIVTSSLSVHPVPPSASPATESVRSILTESPGQITPAAAPTPSATQPVEPLPIAALVSVLPSPTTSSPGSAAASSTSGIQQALSPDTTVGSMKASATPSETATEASKGPQGHPSEWDVHEVVEWLKSKGFDQGVCDQFTEQEITGDVLLELDANVLKSEIGIVAYGKRARIEKAINELRRPPSVNEVEPVQSMPTPRSLTYSFNYPGSHHSQPSHSQTHSVQSSAHHSFSSPMFGPSSPSANGLPSAGLASVTSADSAPLSAELSGSRSGWRASDPGSIHNGVSGPDDYARGRGLGLGLGLPSGKAPKSRPPQLALSPSDGALGETAATAVNGGPASPAVAQDERAVMSESESVRTKDTKSQKRRLFGRSADSTSTSLKEKEKDTASNHSSGTPVTPSPSASPHDEQNPVRRRSKGKSVDDRKGDRLSLFGSSFSGTLGKSNRKPAPRLSSVDTEKHTMGTFSRLREKRSSSRPGTSDGTFKPEKSKSKTKEKEKEKEELTEKQPRDRSVSLSPSKERDPALLRKRTASSSNIASQANLSASAVAMGVAGPTLKAGQSILEQIGEPDHNGWMRKKSERYNSWKLRYFVLKGSHLYWLRSNNRSETKIKGYLNIVGYKVLADENVDPGRYGFRIVHDTEKAHLFSSDEQLIVREWMKALMKATITRDFTNPVMSSCNIPTIPLTVAQAMNPAPRPPSPTARDATQKALRRENPHQLSSRDAQVLLMGMPSKNQNGGERARLESFFTNDTASTNEPGSPVTSRAGPKASAPPRPSRELRRLSTQTTQGPGDYAAVDGSLIEWANSHLPASLKIVDTAGALCGGLALLRLAEDIRGKPSSPPVPDAAFPSGAHDDRLDGLFRLFDYLLDNDVKMGSVSINDIRQGKRDKIVQLLRALKAWEDRRTAIANSLGKGAVAAGPFMGMSGSLDMYRPSL